MPRKEQRRNPDDGVVERWSVGELGWDKSGSRRITQGVGTRTATPDPSVGFTSSSFTKQGRRYPRPNPVRGHWRADLTHIDDVDRRTVPARSRPPSRCAGSSGAAPMGVANDHAQTIVPTPRKAQRKTMAVRGCPVPPVAVSRPEDIAHMMHLSELGGAVPPPGPPAQLPCGRGPVSASIKHQCVTDAAASETDPPRHRRPRWGGSGLELVAPAGVQHRATQ